MWGQEDSNLRSRNNRFTVCPIWPLWYIPFHKKKSRRRDSNPRPTDYKSVALPAELLRLNFLLLKNVPFNWGCKFNNNFCCCKKIYNFFRFFSKIIIFSSICKQKWKDFSFHFCLIKLLFSDFLNSLQPLCGQPSYHLFLYSNLLDKLHLFLQKTVKRQPYVKLHQHYVLMANH